MFPPIHHNRRAYRAQVCHGTWPRTTPALLLSVILLAGCQEARTPVAPEAEAPLLNYTSGTLSGRIVAGREGFGLYGDILLLDLSVGTESLLVSTTAAEEHPALSPDGQTVAFVRFDGSDWELFILDIALGTEKQLTDNADAEHHPAWSPDGNMIAFARNIDIVVLDLANGTETVVAKNGFQPTWSPDGSQIAFARWGVMPTPFYIIVLDLGGGSENVLTKGWMPDWSPDGSAIAFVRWDGNDDELFLRDLATGTEKQLTTNSEDDESPSWAPDGSAIAFARNSPGFSNDEIYVLDLAGLVETKLTTNSVWDDWPDWGK